MQMQLTQWWRRKTRWKIYHWRFTCQYFSKKTPVPHFFVTWFRNVSPSIQIEQLVSFKMNIANGKLPVSQPGSLIERRVERKCCNILSILFIFCHFLPRSDPWGCLSVSDFTDVALADEEWRYQVNTKLMMPIRQSKALWQCQWGHLVAKFATKPDLKTKVKLRWKKWHCHNLFFVTSDGVSGSRRWHHTRSLPW